MMQCELLRTDGRLRNWGRWAASDNGARRARCLSVEHRYVPPKLAEGEDAFNRTTMSLDVLDAEVVERVVCRIVIREIKLFLIDNYVRRYDRLRICRRIRIDQDLLESFHHRALAVVIDHLAGEEVKLIRRGNRLWAGVARIPKASV